VLEERGTAVNKPHSILIRDLTHDGAPETVVLYTIEGPGGRNLYVQYRAVFTRQKGKLPALTRTEVGGKSVRSVELTSVEDDAILPETLGYAPKDASCCLSVRGQRGMSCRAGLYANRITKRRKSGRTTCSRPTLACLLCTF
jgi:hypothetical protein